MACIRTEFLGTRTDNQREVTYKTPSFSILRFCNGLRRVTHILNSRIQLSLILEIVSLFTDKFYPFKPIASQSGTGALPCLLHVNNLFLQLSLLPATETQLPSRRHSSVFFFAVMDFNQLPLTLNVKSATFSHGVLVARYKYHLWAK